MSLLRAPPGPARRALTGALAALLLALAPGCGGSSDGGPDFGDNNPDLIVAMGDSITVGYGDSGTTTCHSTNPRTSGFCPRLEARLGDRIVINEGECGEDSFSAASRFNTILSHWNPGVVLIDYSPNDWENRIDDVIANLQFMVRLAKARKTVPVLATLTPAEEENWIMNGFAEGLNPRIRDLAKQEKVQLADHWQAFMDDAGFKLDRRALLSRDGLHPDANGYDLMARTWHSALKKVY